MNMFAGSSNVCMTIIHNRLSRLGLRKFFREFQPVFRMLWSNLAHAWTVIHNIHEVDSELLSDWGCPLGNKYVRQYNHHTLTPLPFNRLPVFQWFRASCWSPKGYGFDLHLKLRKIFWCYELKLIRTPSAVLQEQCRTFVKFDSPVQLSNPSTFHILQQTLTHSHVLTFLRGPSCSLHSLACSRYFSSRSFSFAVSLSINM